MTTKTIQHEFKSRGHYWRVQSDYFGRFDEIVVRIDQTPEPPKFIVRGKKVIMNPKWKSRPGLILHAEMMDSRSCFVDIAGRCFWVHVGRDGVAKITMEEDRT